MNKLVLSYCLQNSSMNLKLHSNYLIGKLKLFVDNVAVIHSKLKALYKEYNWNIHIQNKNKKEESGTPEAQLYGSSKKFSSLEENYLKTI